MKRDEKRDVPVAVRLFDAASGWGGGVVFKNANQAARDLRALGIDIGSLDE